MIKVNERKKIISKFQLNYKIKIYVIESSNKENFKNSLFFMFTFFEN